MTIKTQKHSKSTKAPSQNDIPNPPPQQGQNANSSTNGMKYGILIIIISILWVIIRERIKENKPLSICNQIPDPSIKFKLQCPKCDAFDTNGKCIIYAPLSSQQFSINAKGRIL